MTDRVISMPITAIQMSNGQLTRGVDAAIGSNLQKLAYMPFNNNNTFVYAPNARCPDVVPDAQCETLHGGFFSADNSTTYKTQASQEMVESISGEEDTIWSTDSLHLGSTALDNFTFGLSTYGDEEIWFAPFNRLGLGQGSTILGRLKDTGAIRSRSWSIFWGQTPDPTAERNGEDGILVLGGYDESKIAGSEITRRLDYITCPDWGMPITITDMTLDFRNGTRASMFNNIGRSSYNYCIDPSLSNIMSLEYTTLFWAFQNLTQTSTTYPVIDRGLGFNFYSVAYANSPSYVYQGGLSLDVFGRKDFAVYSNDLLTSTNTYVTTQGEWLQNDTFAEVLTGLLGAGDGLSQTIHPRLTTGRMFFSTVMLLVNHDADTFTLWPAKTVGQTKIVSVDVNGSCTSLSSASSSTLPGFSAPSGIVLGGGAIAGIVIGAVLVLGILCGFVLRRLASRHRLHRRYPPRVNDDNITSGTSAIRIADTVRELAANEGVLELGTMENKEVAELETVERRHELLSIQHDR